jgi:predicted PurR-regulated permease PerM
MMRWKLKLISRSSESSEQTAIKNTGAIGPVGIPPVQTSAWNSDKQLSLRVLTVLTIGAAYLTYTILRPFLTSLFIAIIMAIASAPLHKFVSRRIRNHTLAALTTTALAIFAVLTPITVVSAKLTVQAISNYRTILSQLSNTATWHARVDPVIEQAAEQTGLPPTQLKAEIVRRARDLRARLISVAGTIAERFAQQMMRLLLGAVFLFPLLRSSDELRHGALGVLPLSPERTEELAVAVNQGVIANIYGMLSVAVAEGILIAIGFWLVGLSSPLIWGTVATVLSFLPFVGVSLVWITGCIFLALHEQWAGAIVLGLWGVIVVSTVDGVVRSRVISGRVKTNSLLITLSLMGGLAVFGPIGFFVGPVSVIVLASLLRILREEHATVRSVRNQVA